MPYGDYTKAIQVEFLCKGCREGKHGCAELWKGLGLEIRCCCGCIPMWGTTETGNARVREGLLEENGGVKGLEFQSEPTTTSTKNQPTTTAGGSTNER